MNKFIASMLLVAFAVLTMSQLARADGSLDSARQTVDSYMLAIMHGDMAGAKALLGGEFLKKNQALLDSPEYASVLSDIYANADYVITDITRINENQIIVEVNLTISPSNVVTSRFTVEEASEIGIQDAMYLIVDEQN